MRPVPVVRLRLALAAQLSIIITANKYKNNENNIKITRTLSHLSCGEGARSATRLLQMVRTQSASGAEDVRLVMSLTKALSALRLLLQKRKPRSEKL